MDQPGMWIVVLLGSVFGLMIVASWLTDSIKSRRICFRSNPDPIKQGFNGCEHCSEREECLGDA